MPLPEKQQQKRTVYREERIQEGDLGVGALSPQPSGGCSRLQHAAMLPGPPCPTQSGRRFLGTG